MSTYHWIQHQCQLHQNHRKFISFRKKAKVQITVIPLEQNTAALKLGSGSQKLEREVAEISKPIQFQVLNVKLRAESLALIVYNHGLV